MFLTPDYLGMAIIEKMNSFPSFWYHSLSSQGRGTCKKCQMKILHFTLFHMGKFWEGAYRNRFQNFIQFWNQRISTFQNSNFAYHDLFYHGQKFHWNRKYTCNSNYLFSFGMTQLCINYFTIITVFATRKRKKRTFTFIVKIFNNFNFESFEEKLNTENE